MATPERTARANYGEVVVGDDQRVL